jgi:hypothetical protein
MVRFEIMHDDNHESTFSQFLELKCQINSKIERVFLLILSNKIEKKKLHEDYF